MSIAKAKKAYYEIMTLLWAESEPPVDYSTLINSSEEVRRAFDFNNHYLDAKRFEEIVDTVIKQYKLSGIYERSIRLEVFLGCSPTSAKGG